MGDWSIITPRWKMTNDAYTPSRIQMINVVGVASRPSRPSAYLKCIITEERKVKRQR
jgi:hypothetical protein